jgi:protein gp37
MGQTKIEWADKSWNPITGCSPISEGCRNCYARRMAFRLKGRYGYPKDDPFRVTFHPDRLNEPLHWKKPSRIFVCSMGDLGHIEVKEKWFENIMGIISYCQQHAFLILTKRPERMKKLLSGFWPFHNFWIGVSVEDQPTADERIPILLQIPAAKRFVSVEPMLEEMDLTKIKIATRHLGGGKTEPATMSSLKTNYFFGQDGDYEFAKLDWVICGGESGPHARPLHPDWVRSLKNQCQAAGVPFFFKHWGPDPFPEKIRRDYDQGTPIYPTGRLLDGREWNEYPA